VYQISLLKPTVIQNQNTVGFLLNFNIFYDLYLKLYFINELTSNYYSYYACEY